jgi:hypothetical protein
MLFDGDEKNGERADHYGREESERGDLTHS